VTHAKTLATPAAISSARCNAEGKRGSLHGNFMVRMMPFGARTASGV
jgi:hypothetical protein